MTELTNQRACLALGYFDSVHLGHRALISAAKKLAEERGLTCAVSTFSNNAYTVFNAREKQVYTYAERCELLRELCDCIVPMRFDTRLKNCPAQKFLTGLTARYDIAAFVCGYDYLFGAGAAGDAELLKRFCAERGIECVVVPKFEVDGERVSTTAVKDALSSGDIAKANAFLGEPFMLRGRVIHGRGAGRMFDMPTANIKLSPGKLLPAEGVYGTECVVDGKRYAGATNVGARPTFGLSRTVVETIISGFNENIYGKEITIYFYKYLRPVIRFDTPAELSRQVHADVCWKK